MAGQYASTTEVPVEKSRAEIEKTLQRYGADAFAYSTDRGTVRIGFRMDGKFYRFGLVLPAADEDRFTTYKQGSSTFLRKPEAAVKLWEQACRQKWRALALVIKAKLEAVASGISTVEDEFLANMVLPDNQTVSDWIQPQVQKAYEIGHMPTSLMLEGPSK
jgi:hypothetical protein